ncbi:MAG: type III-A CRISPR-associated protein Csm2 [Clostridiales bacterium]|nr:type III-A CRISPR-associated protein Csm2 [Clostridiales bacterium]
MSYVDEAEKVIKELYSDRRNKITTTKIRGLLSGISDIYNDAVQIEGDKLTADIIRRIQYLKVQFIYECGRDRNVEGFIKKSGIISKIDSINGSKERFIDMERYMEALVAYHRYYGGKDE